MTLTAVATATEIAEREVEPESIEDVEDLLSGGTLGVPAPGEDDNDLDDDDDDELEIDLEAGGDVDGVDAEIQGMESDDE
jgi:hypothetical protein